MQIFSDDDVSCIPVLQLTMAEYTFHFYWV